MFIQLSLGARTLSVGGNTFIHPILLVEKLRLRELRSAAQGSAACSRQSLDLNTALFPEQIFLVIHVLLPLCSSTLLLLFL